MNLMQRVKQLLHIDSPYVVNDEETLDRLRALAKKVNQDGFYTPDRLSLERKWSQCLFVFGTLQKGHPMHNTFLRNNSASLWNAYTQEPFSCFMHKPDKLPVIIRDKFTDIPLKRVKGKVFSVVPKYISEIDKYLLNGVQSKRERIPLIIPYREVVWIKDRYEFEDKLNQLQQEECTTTVLFEKSPVVLTHVKFKVVNIWAHVGISKYWMDKLDGGYNTGKISTYEPSQLSQIGEYYQVTPKEYDGRT